VRGTRFATVLVVTLLLVIILSTMAASMQPGSDPVSPWPTTAQNFQRTGLSPYNVSVDRGAIRWQVDWPMNQGKTIGPDGNIYGFSYSHDPEYPGYVQRLGKFDRNGTLQPTEWENWVVQTSGNGVPPPTFGRNNTVYLTFSDFGNGTGSIASYYTSGALRWRFTTENTNTGCAIGNDGTVYFGTHSNNLDMGFLYAVDYNGSLLWKLNVGSCDYDPPALTHDGTILILSGAGESPWWLNSRLTAVYPNGSQKWNLSIRSYQGFPVVAQDGRIIVSSMTTDGTNRSMLMAVNPDGTFSWSSEIGPDISCPALDSFGNLYLATYDGELYSYTGEGVMRWHLKYADLGMWDAPAVSNNGVILVCGVDNEYNFFGQYSGRTSYVYAFDLSGHIMWKCGIGEYTINSVIIADDGMILVTNDDGIMAISDVTDWSIPAVIIAAGFFLLLVLVPRNKRGWVIPVLAFFPIMFAALTIMDPTDVWYNLGITAITGLAVFIWMWASLHWTHNI
jgi:hypothetical protein